MSNNLKLLWFRAIIENRSGPGWYFLRTLFIPLGWVYRMVIALRVFVYKIGLCRGVHPGRTVISVGNITVGGTGKTPFVYYLACCLGEQDKRVAIIARGYGKTTGATDDEILPQALKNVTRHTHPDRLSLARQVIAGENPDALILDDGFQHWLIKPDINIVLVDSLNPFGNGRLVPAGILREPVSALKRADLIVLTHADSAEPGKLTELKEFLGRFGKPVIPSIHKPVALMRLADETGLTGLTELTGKPAWAFCGIGNPHSFRLTLEKLGCPIKGFSVFPDHYPYSESDLTKLTNQAQSAGARMLLTTAKDIAHLKSLESARSGTALPLYCLRIELEMAAPDRESLQELVNNKISR